MFSDSLTESEVNRSGASSDLRYFHTSYGQTFGYNERARKYHRSYGLVTPPSNPAFSDFQLGDLATAPLFRRDHLGFRADYPEDIPFSWSEGATKLKKQSQTTAAENVGSSTLPSLLPPRTVQWHGSASASSASPSYNTIRRNGGGFEQEEQLRYDEAQRQQQQQWQQQSRSSFNDPTSSSSPRPLSPAASSSQQAQTGRAILTSSLSPSRFHATAMSSTSLTSAQQQLIKDGNNANLYPLPGLKSSKFNPQFDAPQNISR